MKIKGSVAIVFGAARGIGLAYTNALLERGASVCMTDIRDEEGRKAEKELQKEYLERIFFESCDVCNEDMIKDVFDKVTKQYGPPEIIVFNSGIIHEFEWQKCLDINLGGVIRCFNITRERIGKQNGGKGGVFIATSSISGLRTEYWAPVYCATKHAINAYVRSWAEDKNYAAHGIRLNTICPSRVDTQFIEQINEERAINVREHLGTKDYEEGAFTPEDIAKKLIMLLEDDSINGQLLRVTRTTGTDFVKFEEQPIQ